MPSPSQNAGGSSGASPNARPQDRSSCVRKPAPENRRNDLAQCMKCFKKLFTGKGEQGPGDEDREKRRQEERNYQRELMQWQGSRRLVWHRYGQAGFRVQPTGAPVTPRPVCVPPPGTQPTMPSKTNPPADSSKA